MQTVVDFFFCIAHVEHAGQDHATTEVGEAEEVHQEEEQQQQYVGEDQEQALEQDLTDFFNTQGKHRFMYPSILPKFKFMQAPVHLQPSVTTLSLSLKITILLMHLS